jgi:hypothetical protein
MTFITSCTNNYLIHIIIQSSLSTDPKKFWAFIRNNRANTRIHGIMHYNDQQHTYYLLHRSPVYILSDPRQHHLVTSKNAKPHSFPTYERKPT